MTLFEPTNDASRIKMRVATRKSLAPGILDRFPCSIISSKPPFVLLVMFARLSSWAQTTIDFSYVSPELRSFLLGDEGRMQSLSQTLLEAAQGRKFSIYYFYTDDESVPRADHIYSSDGHVDVEIRENQSPADQFMCLLFELMNSENESSFKELSHLAQAGEVKREDFPIKIIRLEFATEKRLRDLLPRLNLSEQEKAGSYYFEKERLLPEKFDDFLLYRKKIAPLMDPVKGYEKEYDALRKEQ